MKSALKFSTIVLLAAALGHISCQKEFSCENCRDNPTGSSNKSPIAHAGADQAILLPVDSVILNGSASTDPDNNIISYAWINLSGPSPCNIATANAVQTKVSNLAEGIYQFELTVTDADSLFSKDTIQIIVLKFVPACPDRPYVYGRLVPIGSLSMKGGLLASATAGNKIFFGGGVREIFSGGIGEPGYSTRVDIYDITTNTWSIAELSQRSRQGMATAVVGNKVFFAGGGDNDNGIVTSRVDIFDVSNNSWSTAELSQGREYLAAATIGNKVFFAGGGSWDGRGYTGSNVVDIYDNATNTWSTAELSKSRSYLTATTVGNKVFFAGGVSGLPGPDDGSTQIDIYDAATNSWSTSNLQQGKYFMASIAAGNKIFWGSGVFNENGNYQTSDQVEIKNINTGVSSFACMIPRYNFSAVLKDDNIVFFTGYSPNSTLEGGNHFEIYNTTSDTWSTGVLNLKLSAAAIISVNNTIYVAGGMEDYNSSKMFSQVWKLEF
ncbi:Kelch repeat-containing protein [Flavihumibacter fluvii]|uniref:Kelch repeat-containing protein n=1 Tax=Flavihumibacter fluvii TaxID=2838157 RepID=UPI001BDF364C|nr:kelch repeat-containing protein [Flavihumibacter fluvii]ULQ54725.1 hypothetical protein KJS93_10385 [Flavihumibacter fluvii]